MSFACWRSLRNTENYISDRLILPTTCITKHVARRMKPTQNQLPHVTQPTSRVSLKMIVIINNKQVSELTAVAQKAQNSENNEKAQRTHKK